MAVPGPGHSEQEQELHKSLIRDEEDDAEIEQAFANVPAVPPNNLSFSVKDPTTEELRHAYDQKIRKRPTTPTSACVLDGIAFFASSVDQSEQSEHQSDAEKIKVSIPNRRRKTENMSYSEFYDSMASQIPGASGRRMSASGRTTPLHDYEGDILDEFYKDKAPPAPVVHRRSSIEWENFADMEEKMEQAEQKVKNDDEMENEEVKEKEKDNDVKVEASREMKKMAFYAKPPTVEVTSPDAPHIGAFHDPKEPQVVKEEEGHEEGEEGEEEEEDEMPTFSEDMSEERQRIQKEEDSGSANMEVAGQEGGEVAQGEEYCDPNAYPGYIWNYDTQQWDVDPNYVGYDQAEYAENAYDPAAHVGYDQPTDYEQQPAPTAEEHVGYDQAAYDQSAYDHSAYAQQYEQTAAEGDAAQEYDYSAYGGYEGYLEACRAYDEANGTGGQQQYDENVYAGYGDAYQGYNDTNNTYDYNQATTDNYNYQQEGYDYNQQYQQPEQEVARPVVMSEPLFKQAPQPSDPFGWESQAAPQPAELPRLPSEHPVEELSPTPEASSSAPARPPPARPEAPKKDESTAPPARPPPAKQAAPPRPAPAKHVETPKEPEVEEDAWAQFKKMTEKVSDLVKTTETTLKTLEETSATKDIKDESYLAQIGGSQGFVNESTQKEIQRLTDEKKMEKMQKKKLKQQGKKCASPPLDPDQEDAMDRAAQELAIKLANMRTDIGDWKAPELVQKKEEPTKRIQEIVREDSASAIPPRKKSSIKDVQQDSGGSLELPPHLAAQYQDTITPKGDHAPDDPILSAPAWADFDTSEPMLPPSESGFFSNKDASNDNAARASHSDDPFVINSVTPKRPSIAADPFAPQQPTLIDESYDPFAVVAVEEVVAMAKAKAEQAAANADNEDDFYNGRQSPHLSTPTPEGGSPISQRPNAFEDDFKCEMTGLDTPTPLYDEDDSQPLVEFLPKFSGDGWELMVRHPIKKKSFMAERCWKPCFVRLHGTTLFVYNDKKDSTPIQELLLQATYSLSDTTLQAYDVYGKIHTVKLQYVVYKEKVGIRPGQISRLVDGHITKYGLPLEHSAQCTVLLKFGSLAAAELQSFVTTIEDILFKCQIARTTKPVYKQDEVQIHCYDEYSAFVDKDGILSDQKARVRLFCLAFLTGSPLLEVGLNDRRRQGKEIVRRKDILPMYTERWIRFEDLEFHSIVNKPEFDKEQVISFSPPDGCFFEIMRFRIRPPRNREKAMSVKSIMKIAGSKVEIRIEAMAAAQIQRTRGSDERRNIPCEDIAIRFPIPEAWIYLFREERHWGVGSIHSKKLRPGKVKNLKDRLLGAVQAAEPNLIECAIGEAKYEHVYRSLVWRIPRLPEKHHAAYKSHLLKCRFELSSFDLMPEEFLPRCEVDFTMPLATVSNTVVRSVSVEQHEDSDRVEKFVRYVAKYQYKVEIDYVQCANLDLDMADPSVNPEVAAAPVPDMHQPQFQGNSSNPENPQGYRIDFNDAEMGGANPRDDSSSDDEPDSHKMPIVKIDMKNYGY